jgi:hypothetical protein
VPAFSHVRHLAGLADFSRLCWYGWVRQVTLAVLDVFRGGNPKDLSKALLDAVSTLEQKSKNVTFTSADAAHGGARARLDAAISRLRDYANELAKSKTDEREDYHWEIIGALVSVIAVLLKKRHRLLVAMPNRSFDADTQRNCEGKIQRYRRHSFTLSEQPESSKCGCSADFEKI